MLALVIQNQLLLISYHISILLLLDTVTILDTVTMCPCPGGVTVSDKACIMITIEKFFQFPFTGRRVPRETAYFRQKDKSWKPVVKNEDNLWCTEKKKVVLSQQPTPDQIIVMRRHYAWGPKNSFFSRVHSYIVDVRQEESHLKSLVFVQYLGVMPPPRPHGNAATEDTNFYRTHTSVKPKVIQLLKEGHEPHEVLQTLNTGDPIKRPRNRKQIKNIKYLMDSPFEKSANAADEVNQMLNLCYNHPFLREAHQMEDCPPSFFCHGPYAIQDIKRFCMADSKLKAILGLDKTFGLSRCFVSPTCYENPLLRRTGTDTVPLIMGPVWIHWNSTYESYATFLFSIKKKLAESNISHFRVHPQYLRMGSDQEKSFFKASRVCFGDVLHVSCTRHLQEDLQRYLTDKLGFPQKTREKIVHQMMHLRTAKNLDEFTSTTALLAAKFKHRYPPLIKYFDYWTSILKRYVVIPCLEGNISRDYKTNCSESLNALLRLKTRWRSKKLQDLLKILQDLEAGQRAMIRRALYDPSEYVLAPEVAHLQVPPARWARWSESKRQKHEEKFYAYGMPQQKKTTITATKSNLTIPNLPNVAKKKGARKRPRAERTTTLKKGSKNTLRENNDTTFRW